MSDVGVSVSRRPPPPPWLAGLATDRRGFLVPAETPWFGGVPRLAQVGTSWKVALAAHRACAVCGYPLAVGRPVYRAFSQADAATIRTVQRDLAEDISGPGHHSCMLYAAQVCPFLAQGQARLGKTSTVAPGARRGKLAAIMGFQDAALMLYARPHQALAHDAPQPMFGYHNLVDDLPYREGRSLTEHLEAAVADDAPHIEQARRRYWPEDERAGGALMRTVTRAFSTLSGVRPVLRVDVRGAPYAGYALPVL